LSKYLKYFVVFLIVLLSSFIAESITPNKTNLATHIAPLKTATPTIKEKPFSVESYPVELTQKVSHKLDSLLVRINKRHDFNGTILVAKNGKILYENQAGYANFKKKEPLKKESIYQLASVSKQFTAAAILILQERGQLKLSDSVTTYFPDFPFKDVTIKHLLNHTSGLPKYFWIAEHEWKKENIPDNTEMMELLTTSVATKFFRPGRNFDYSNTGYFVLASLVEKISNTSFKGFLKANIFEPLNMNSSYVYQFEKDTVQQNQLEGFRLYRGWRHLPIKGTVNDAIVGDKNVYTTSEDLYKWIYGLNHGKIISKESLEMMYTKGKTVYNREIPYGLGFRIKDLNNEKIIYHNGKWNGFRTSISQYPKDDLVVIILEHTSYNAITSLNKKIRKIVDTNFQS